MSTSIAFVPVRAGSRSIRLKNLRDFCGRPLVAWCLRALQASTRVDRIVVSTDGDAIAEAVLGLDLPKVVVHRRSAETATDTASTESAMLEYIASAALSDDDLFLLVQATSPFTRAEDIDGAFALYDRGGVDSILSGVRSKRFFWGDDGKPVNYDPAARPRRQDFGGYLMENGALYLNRVGNIRAHANRLSGRVAVYEMSEYTGVELDEETDWVVAETLFRQNLPTYFPALPDIRILLSDVDGVLTDAGMYYGESGEELKKFNTRDGMGFDLLRGCGIKIGIITGEDTAMVTRRAKKLKMDHLYQGIRDKLPVVERICAAEGLELHQVAYVGDDVGDLTPLQAVGFAACPRTAEPAIKRIAHYICTRGGGEGCVREVAEMIMASRAGG
jgi:YrbI family 3-deoxy-D-manno-octulosonate 8-phosphate phosphatase